MLTLTHTWGEIIAAIPMASNNLGRLIDQIQSWQFKQLNSVGATQLIQISGGNSVQISPAAKVIKSFQKKVLLLVQSVIKLL